MMQGKGGANNGNNMGGAQKSIKDKRMEFELNQQAAAAHRNKAGEGGFEKAFKEA